MLGEAAYGVCDYIQNAGLFASTAPHTQAGSQETRKSKLCPDKEVLVGLEGSFADTTGSMHS